MNGFVLDGVENITGPREKAGNHHFLRFPQCFQKSRENMGFYGTGSSFEAQNRYDSTNMYFFLFHFVFSPFSLARGRGVESFARQLSHEALARKVFYPLTYRIGIVDV